MEYEFFGYLAIILFSTKIFGIIMKKLGLPQVVGSLIAGLLIGPMVFGWVVPAEGSSSSVALKYMAEIGVIMIMFSAGLETDIKEIKRNGKASVVITILGVVIPIALGFLITVPFNGGFSGTEDQMYQNFFMGIVLSATSVGITVETLKELGKLKGKVGTSIMSAAVLDDIIGIVVLTVAIGMKSATSGNADAAGSITNLLINLSAFVACVAAIGLVCYFLFKWMDRRFANMRRLPIFGLVLCFFMAWMAEQFGIADITGAYFAGLIISVFKKSSSYVERKIDISSYMLFSPIFFAYIGIDIHIEGFDMNVVYFSLALIAIGLLSKLLGCGAGARMCGYSNMDSLRVGIGMIARGEVALIVAQKGLSAGLVDVSFMPAIIILVVVSSLVTPILLKLTYKKKKDGTYSDGGKEAINMDERDFTQPACNDLKTLR